MVAEAFRVSDLKVKITNITYLIFIFMIWVSTCVAFGSALFTLTLSIPSSNSINAYVYWNKAIVDGTSYSFNEWGSEFSDTGSGCSSGGKAYLAFNIFAFLILLCAVLPLAVTRLLSIQLPIIRENTQKSILYELIGICVTTFWLFLAIAVYGGKCFQKFASKSSITTSNADIPLKTVGTGFGYSIVCFLFCLISIVLIAVIRNNPLMHLGSDAEAASMNKNRSEYHDALANSEQPAASNDANLPGYQSDNYDPTNTL